MRAAKVDVGENSQGRKGTRVVQNGPCDKRKRKTRIAFALPGTGSSASVSTTPALTIRLEILTALLRRFAFFFGLQDPVVKGDQVLPERAVDFAEGGGVRGIVRQILRFVGIRIVVV
jgi:hypothetical protein